MRAYLISDGEFASKQQERLDRLLCAFLKPQGFEIERKEIQRDELAFCRGCFECWTKTPGECSMKDGIAAINRACMESDVVVYFCPVVFGQFSTSIKSAIDRWLPNMLPFFETRKDGSTMHPPRYPDYPRQIMIGYAESLTDEDARLFTDITMKHRSNIPVLVDRGDDDAFLDELKSISFTRVGGAL